MEFRLEGASNHIFLIGFNELNDKIQTHTIMKVDTSTTDYLKIFNFFKSLLA